MTSERLAFHVLQCLSELVRAGFDIEAKQALDKAWTEYENFYRYGEVRAALRSDSPESRDVDVSSTRDELGCKSAKVPGDFPSGPAKIRPASTGGERDEPRRVCNDCGGLIQGWTRDTDHTCYCYRKSSPKGAVPVEVEVTHTVIGVYQHEDRRYRGMENVEPGPYWLIPRVQEGQDDEK